MKTARFSFKANPHLSRQKTLINSVFYRHGIAKDVFFDNQTIVLSTENLLELIFHKEMLKRLCAKSGLKITELIDK
jgi:hypothetical protein